jgi:hypothetical protein
VKETSNCLVCHDSAGNGIPRLLVLSTIPDAMGPISGSKVVVKYVEWPILSQYVGHYVKLRVAAGRARDGNASSRSWIFRDPPGTKFSWMGVRIRRKRISKIDDPGAYTRPGTVALDFPWSPDFETQEYICQANNRSQENYVKEMKGAMGNGNAGADSDHGHSAKGSIVGDWGPNANAQDTLMVLMDWAGKSITGTINPGPKAVPITTAELNPDDWSLHVEGGTGANRVVLYGKFENLTWLARSLAGTYTRGNQRGTFRITRKY